MNPPFIKGLDLSQRFYEQAVKPILRQHFRNLSYAAVLIGKGSEVLEFDTPQSQDHDWGPRLMLFLTETDYQNHHEKIDQTLRQKLPSEIESYPTNFARSSDGTTWMVASEDGEINHGVMFFTVHGFCRSVLNLNPDRDLNAIDWLTIPEHILRAIISGCVFYDGLGQLEPLRAKLHYYPHDVWLYQLASQWTRISQEEAFMGCCGQVDDELGSRLVAARLIRDLMRLCFLMEQQYAPYIKWFSTAFAQLGCATKLMPIFNHILNATQWQQREKPLTQAYTKSGSTGY